jgi:hypothetical protein
VADADCARTAQRLVDRNRRWFHVAGTVAQESVRRRSCAGYTSYVTWRSKRTIATARRPPVMRTTRSRPFEAYGYNSNGQTQTLSLGRPSATGGSALPQTVPIPTSAREPRFREWRRHHRRQLSTMPTRISRSQGPCGALGLYRLIMRELSCN